MLFKLERWKKRFIQIMFDILIIPLSLLIGFFLRTESFDFLFDIDTYIAVFILLATTLSIFYKRGLYNTFTRHISIESANTIFLGCAISCIIFYSSNFFLNLQIPQSVPLIYAIVLCVISISIRYFIRVLANEINQETRSNVAIYGAGVAATQLMDALKRNSNYRVCCFIDDEPELQGQTLGGIPIENFNNAKIKFKKLKIETLLITKDNGVDNTHQKLFDILTEQPLKIKTIPSITSLIKGNTNIVELEDLNIEDLLGRKPVIPDPKLMSSNITNKTVLVTGAGGSIGSELCRQIIQWSPLKLVLLDVSEFAIYKLERELKEQNHQFFSEIIPIIGSVQDILFLKRVMDRFTIDTIYHAAAYKHVPLMEQNVMQCIENNVFGTLNIVEKSIDAKVKNFILVSTDKAVNPTNFMGASKRIAEMICQSASSKDVKTCFSVVRFGNVLASSGSVVPLFKKQIENGGPITLTHPDVTRYFMTIPEAAQLVIQAGSMAIAGKVFVLDMGKPIKIMELAKKMVTLSGLKPVLTNSGLHKKEEIFITISGLRPGEKLYEELSYSSNLIGTKHPRIMTTNELPMNIDELNLLLSKIRFAINDKNHENLFQIISSVTDGVSDISKSNDVFVSNNISKKNSVVPIKFKKDG